MTHLKIEQNTTGIELVSSAVIKKLYDLVYSGTLDNTSNLLGRLHTTATRKIYVDYLTTLFSNLYITADKLYLTFADSEVERVLTTAWGDGTGVTMADTALQTSTGTDTFKNNTTILTFDELGLFTTVTSIGTASFYGCTALTSIDLSNVTEVKTCAFQNCSNLTSVDLSSLTYIGGGKAFNGIGTTRLVFPKIVGITAGAFEGSNFLYLEFGEDLTTIGYAPFWNSSNLNTLVFRSTTVPTYTDPNNRKFLYNMNNLTIYVPDASLNDYKTTGLWASMADHIKGISELPVS